MSLFLMGCSEALEQESQTVRVAPVSEQYKLDHKLEGKTYILVAETSTGKEQYRYVVSDSLARAMKEGGWCAPNVEDLGAIPFLGMDSKVEVTKICDATHEVLSFTDFANKLNERGLGDKLAEMKKFYEENGMFKKADLQFLAQEIGADYLVLPCLLDIRRWSQGRLSVVGVKFLNTQIVSGMLGLEIWDTRAGRKVFSATSDLTIANERIREEPISMEEAFERAWLGIISQLPGQSPVTEMHIADDEAGPQGTEGRVETQATTNNEKQDSEGKTVDYVIGKLVSPAVEDVYAKRDPTRCD
jgi:hypothetical protein